jgi:hypothetical protein
LTLFEDAIKELNVESPRVSKAESAAAALQSSGDSDINPAPETGEAVQQCPKCHSKLIDPHGLGWCKACGYCKSLSEDKARVPLDVKPAPSQPSVLGLVEFGQLLAQLPNWAWVLIGGVAMVAAIDIPLSMALQGDGLPRAIFSTLQIVLGVLMIVAAQTWSLVLLAPSDDKLGIKEAMLPSRLWGMTVKQLPETRGQVWLASWGLACILSAIFIVGGLTHWLSYLPKKVEPPPVVEEVE